MPGQACASVMRFLALAWPRPADPLPLSGLLDQPVMEIDRSSPRFGAEMKLIPEGAHPIHCSGSDVLREDHGVEPAFSRPVFVDGATGSIVEDAAMARFFSTMSPLDSIAKRSLA